jgi:hypothetical protein
VALAVGLGVAVALGPVLGMEMVSRFLVDAIEPGATNMETGDGSVWILWDPADFSERRRQKLQVLSSARIQSEDKLAGADCIDKVGWAT